MSHGIVKIAALSFGVYCSTAVAENCQVPKEGYDIISTSLPETQAAIEAKKTNPQFLGILNYSLAVPGVPGAAQCWSREGLVSVIPGTTDTPCSEALNIFQYAAGLYARDFNKQLLVLVPKLGQHNCGKVSAQ